MAKDVETKLKVPKKDYKKGDLPETREDWIAYVNKCHDASLADRRKYEFQWTINIAYYMGYQNLVFDRTSGILRIPTELSAPLTINRIGSFIEARHAKLIKNRPVPRVMPEDPDDPEDINAAKNADHALLHLWRKTDQDEEYDTLLTMMLLCGTAFKENLWDPISGDSIITEATDGDDLLIDADTGGILEEEVFMGEISSRALSAFAILPANDAIREVRDQPWMMKRVLLPIADLEKRYPHLRGKIRKQDVDTSMTEHEKIVQRLGSPIFHMTGSMQNAAYKDTVNSHALLKFMMIKPNHQYERGVMIGIVGNELATIDVWPNDWGKNVYPWIKFSEKKTGFHFWNQSTIERLIPVQRQYNRLKQQKAKNAALMANVKWLLAKGSQVQEDALNDEEGEIIEYNASVPEPKPAQIQGMPAYVSEFGRELINDFRDVGGQRESSVSPPAGVTAGNAMSIAAELADEIMGPIIQRVVKGMELDANQQLLLMDQEYIEKRKVKIMGDGGHVGVMWFDNADLKHHTDVKIEIESMFPEFRASKRQTLIDLWDRRIVQDPAKILKAFKYGNFDVLLEESDKIEEMIDLGISTMKKGKMPEFNPADNHLMWVQKLTAFMQTPEFLRLIPERKQIFQQTAQMHLAMVLQQLPGMGQPMGQQNQAAMGTPFGSQKPVGAQAGGGGSGMKVESSEGE